MEIAWEDSMEMHSVVWWTPGLENRFYEDRGYDIRECLPFLVTEDNSWGQQFLPYAEGFRSVDPVRGQKCNEDYRAVLQQCYEEYVLASVEWSRERGIEYSNQPAYNLPLNMVSTPIPMSAQETRELIYLSLARSTLSSWMPQKENHSGSQIALRHSNTSLAQRI